MLDLFRTAGRNLVRNRMRTALTMLGIVIGVASVIIMVAVGKGAESDIQSNIQSMGTNLLMIRAGNNNQVGGVRQGSDGKATLLFDDVDQIRNEAKNIQAVSGVNRTNAQLVFGNKNWPCEVNGVQSDFLIIKNRVVNQGRMFTSDENAKSRKVAVIGTTVATELFGTASPLGKTIRIGQVPMQVIGILKSEGENSMGQDQDNIVLIPLKTLANRLQSSTRLRQIVASAQSMDVMNLAQKEIESILRRSHKLGSAEENDFQVKNQSEIMETASSMTQTLTMLLSAIAAVSLLVGGIGIMNIMLVSVTERTREIGIRMALGARSKDILVQFLVESMVLCSIGGVTGIALAVGTVTILTQMVGLSAILEPQIAIYAFGFSALVGIFFGFYPAKKASKLRPIEALRYE